ncbi:MAG: efflux RND transporter periplasmic adaptor subunit [Acidobacteria bacterium]|nr:efflux RND transporter periplasmic adaptor subunit [Acidobacteriota bacterium]
MTRAIAVGVVGFALGIAAAVLVAVNPAGWAWPSQLPSAFREAAPSAAAAPLDAPASRDDREILYWRAPMDPTFTSDRPGRSPMGMDLVPVYADGAEPLPPGMVRVDPGFTQSIGVRTQPVARRDIAQTIRTVGTLAHNDRQIAWVNTKYDGWIENVAVNYLGETVAHGQVLFDIYSPQLVATQMEYLQAVDYAARLETSEYPAIAERARSLVASARTRLNYWDITDDQILTLERERTPRRTLSVQSPVTGVVVEKLDQALDGMYVEAGMNLYKMADLTTIWVDVEVFEHQVEAMRVGQRARVELPYLPGRPYTGFVRYLYPHFDERTRTMTVSIELENPDLTLRAGMYANVTFDVPVARNALAVPEEAVIRGGTRDLVVLERSPGTFQVAAVTLGRYGDGVWEVLDGIDDGDSLVLSAQFLIDSESNLTAAIRNLDSGADMAAMPAEHRHADERPPSSSGAPTAPSMPVGHRHDAEDSAPQPGEARDGPAAAGPRH